MYSYEQLLEPRGYSSSLGLGSLVHAFIEADRGGRPMAFQEELDSMKARYADEFMAAIDLDFLAAKDIFRAWSAHWALDLPFGNGKFEWVKTEAEWSLPVNANFTLVGKSDGLVKHLEWGSYFLYELKTAADRDRETYIHDLEMNRQVTNNILAWRERGYDVQGALYDIIWKPAVRARKDETEADVKRRMVGLIAEKPLEQLERRIVYRNDRVTADHMTDVAVTAEMLARCRADKTWPRFTGSCRKYNQLCPYWSMCLEGNEEMESLYGKREKKLPELSKEIQVQR